MTTALDRLLARPRRRAEITFPVDPNKPDGDTVTFHLEALGNTRYQAVADAHRWAKGDPLNPDGSEPPFGPGFEVALVVACTTRVVAGDEVHDGIDDPAFAAFRESSPTDDVGRLVGLCVALNTEASAIGWLA